MLCGGLWALTVVAVAAEPEIPAANTPEASHCLEQFRSDKPWIECPVTLQPDAQARDAISQVSLGVIRNATCRTDVRLERKGLVGTYLVGGVLQLQPHEVSCDVETQTFLLPSVKITVAPKVTILNQTVTDVSVGVVNIADVPPFVVAPIRDAAESKYVRQQLAKALNVFLRQAFAP
jgi:hypothetical protein